MDFDDGTIQINGQSIALEFASKYNVYNLCAAYTIASLLNVPAETITGVLNDFVMKNGRNVRFTAGQNEGFLITSKHENSTSYNQSLAYVAAQKDASTLVIIVDAISRKYYTAETSWLWDISFELLEGSKVKNIILSGKYAYDLALRFEFAGITSAKIIVQPDLDEMGKLIAAPEAGKIYAVTCFSDKEKLFDRVKVQTPTAK
jgi:UDP-N-acetylmuramyl tripeptide synthase